MQQGWPQRAASLTSNPLQRKQLGSLSPGNWKRWQHRYWSFSQLYRREWGNAALMELPTQVVRGDLSQASFFQLGTAGAPPCTRRVRVGRNADDV